MTVVDAVMGGPVITENGVTRPVASDGTPATAWGIPIGRISEVVGGYSTGKSTYIETVAKKVQEIGGDVFMGITEYTLDPERMVRMGCDPQRICYKEFEFIEDGFDWVVDVLTSRISKKAKTPCLVTWDTVGASHSKDERPGSGGREVREGLRRITNLVAKAHAIMIFVNQTSASFDQWETEPATPFGMGVRFHASIRLEFKGQKKFIESEGVQAGKQTFLESRAAYGIEPVVTCRKNKTFPPFRRCRMPITFQGGLDDEYGMFLYLSQRKSIITVTEPQEQERHDAGSVITFRMDPPVACYWNEYRQFLVANPKVHEWMVEQCRTLAYNGFDPIAS
jgi:recombination protein RecA